MVRIAANDPVEAAHRAVPAVARRNRRRVFSSPSIDQVASFRSGLGPLPARIAGSIWKCAWNA